MISSLTVLHLSNFPFRMFRACITITPEIMAFVVAIAGIIFPAIAKEKKKKYISPNPKYTQIYKVRKL